MPQTLVVDGRKVVFDRMFTSGNNMSPTICMRNGEFIYMNGSRIKNRAHFNELPEPFKSDALAAFDKKQNKVKENGNGFSCNLCDHDAFKRAADLKTHVKRYHK